MSGPYFALWANRNGQRSWEGPFPTNVAAQRHLNMITDKSGGSLVVPGMPAMTPGERLEAGPVLDSLRAAGCTDDEPLPGYRPGVGHRCRLCGAQAAGCTDDEPLPGYWDGGYW